MKKIDQENPRDHSLHLLSTNHRHETKQFVAAWICPEMGYTVCIKSAYPILASVGNGKRYVSSYLSTQDFPRCGGFRGFQFFVGQTSAQCFFSEFHTQGEHRLVRHWVPRRSTQENSNESWGRKLQ